MHADKAKEFIGKGCPCGEPQDKGIQENCSAAWLSVLPFMVMELVYGVSRAYHYDSGSFLVTPTSLSQDGFQQEGF